MGICFTPFFTEKGIMCAPDIVCVNIVRDLFNFFIILGGRVPKQKHKSDAMKRNEKNRADQLIESQRGVLDRYFLATSIVDVHGDNRRQESDPEQDNDQSLSVDHEVNEQSLDDSK
jgi:hypothetical protein